MMAKSLKITRKKSSPIVGLRKIVGAKRDQDYSADRNKPGTPDSNSSNQLKKIAKHQEKIAEAILAGKGDNLLSLQWEKAEKKKREEEYMS